jgi:hypothetical protein
VKASKFLSNYLKAISLEADRDVTVRSVREERMGIGDRAEKKLVLYFVEIEQGLPLNKTNARIMIKNFGDETDSWAGAKIRLTIKDVQSPQGGICDGIVIEAS